MRKGKETLMADQMIFKRCEIKYMLDITQAELLKNQMKQYMTADEHGFFSYVYKKVSATLSTPLTPHS